MYVQRNRGRTDIFFAQNACQSDRCLSRRSIWPSTPWMCPLIRPLKLQVGLRQHAHSRFWMVLRGSGKSVSYQRNSSGANSCHCFSGCLFFVLNASFALLCKLKLFWDQKSRMPLGILWRSWKATWRLFSHHPGFSPRREISTEWCSRQIWGGWDISTRLEWRDKLRRLYDSSSRFMPSSPWIPPNPVQDLNGKSTAYHSAQPCAVLMLWTAFYRNMQETCMNLASTKMYKDVQSQLSFFTQFQGWMSGVSLFSGLWNCRHLILVVLKIWFKPRHSPLCGITMAEPEEEEKEKERKPETQSPSDLLSDFTSLSSSKCSLFSSSLNGDKGCFCMFPYHSISFHTIPQAWTCPCLSWHPAKHFQREGASTPRVSHGLNFRCCVSSSLFRLLFYAATLIIHFLHHLFGFYFLCIRYTISSVQNKLV